ncbi:MAG: hypothetical protein ABI779_25860 [Acidobacteriota bacterium]
MMRERLLSLCAALWGLAIAIALLPRWTTPAPAGQLPGFATSAGFDARAPFFFIAGVIALPVIVALLMRPLIDRLAAAETRPWTRNTAALAMLVPIWLVIVERDLLFTTLPTAIAVATCVVLRTLSARFTRRDWILLPTTAGVFLAILDLSDLPFAKSFVLALALVLAVRLGIVLMRPRSALPAHLCFALSPLALAFQTRFVPHEQRLFGWMPLAVAVVTPFVLRALVGNTPVVRRRLRHLVVYVCFPIAVSSYVVATSLTRAEGKPRFSFFEETYHLVPASEMLRGRTPYRDIIPAHGLVQDGLLDVLLLGTGGETIGRSMRGRGAIGALNSIACYALGAAVTGSPEAGIAVFFLGASLGTADGSPRVLPALLSLALMVAAVRRRNPRLLFWAGAGAIVTGLTSIDHGMYILATLVFATTRLRRGWRFAGLGLLAAAVPAVLAMVITGIFVPFVRTSLFEMATLGPVYALKPFQVPPIFVSTFHYVPELLAAMFDRGAYLYLVWIGALLFVAVALTTRPPALPRRRARFDALLTLSVWIVVVAISYAERQHLPFRTAVPALLVGAALYVSARWRWMLPVAVVLMLAIAQPTTHLAMTAWLRRAHGPLDPSHTSEPSVLARARELYWPLDPKDSRELSVPARAGGAFWFEEDVVTVRAAGAYLDRLPPGDTFFDFTNHGLLYFLFDRYCPVRQLEVAFYEREEVQREVISRIERDPHVVAALVPPFPEYGSVDHVPNAVRAPLVWSYLQSHFRPDYQEGNVVFWKRK